MTPQERESVAKEAEALFNALVKMEDKHRLRFFSVDQATKFTAAAMPALIEDVLRHSRERQVKPEIRPKPVPYREDVYPPGHPLSGQKRYINGG